MAAALLISTASRARPLKHLSESCTMSAPIQYAPCIYLHTSSERPCPRCFVHGPHRKQKQDLVPKEPTCSICFNDYNTPNSETSAVETHVKLPCGHTFGNRCLMRYLSPAPSGGHGSACPTCKYELFRPRPKPKLEEAEITRQLEELEEQRAITERMLRTSIRHHQTMARNARLPTIEEVLDGKEPRNDRRNSPGWRNIAMTMYLANGIALHISSYLSYTAF